MAISIIEVERPRKARFAFRCHLSDDIVDNCALIGQQMNERPGAWNLVASNAGNWGTINVYTDDETAAEHFRRALAFSKEFHSPR